MQTPLFQYERFIVLVILIINCLAIVLSQTNVNQKEGHLYSDTWVATDALNRKLPTAEDVGNLKTDRKRIVSIFYTTWHGQHSHVDSLDSYTGDVSRILRTDSTARLNTHHPLWQNELYHWAEPELGYFLSMDEFVIRKDISMLVDAGVDLLILDATNGFNYFQEWDQLFSTMLTMKNEGNKVPLMCFWAFNGPVITRVQEIYEYYYKNQKFRELWFYWNDKPLLLYNQYPETAGGRKRINYNPNYLPEADILPSHPHYKNPDFSSKIYTDYTKEVKSFFTLRNMWWGYKEWNGQPYVGMPEKWSFGYELHDIRVYELPLEKLVSTTKEGVKEQAVVTPAQHASSFVGKSWSRTHFQPNLNQLDLPDSAFIPYLNCVKKNPQDYGIYFQERWNEAIAVDPLMIFVNDWNEWIARKIKNNDPAIPFLGRKSDFYFVDQYNAEFNRTIQPMKGGYSDNYYMQMISNIRRYKGVTKIPEYKGHNTIQLNGRFDDWENINSTFFDTNGDIVHRNHDGYGGLKYTNTTGRNDIRQCKLAVSKKNIYFYVVTQNKLTSHQDPDWMLLLIDIDQNAQTGWCGYEYVINQSVLNKKKTKILKYADNTWVQVATINYNYRDNQLELGIPLRTLGLDEDKIQFDFKWCDNTGVLVDKESMLINGDTAPNRRFNYRFIWNR